MTVILEKYPLPRAGSFEIHETVEIAISGEEAQRKVSQWLFFDVTMMLRGEEPDLVVGEKTVWRVPVCFSVPDVGRVGIVGYINMDAQSGEIDSSPEIVEALLESTQALEATLPPFKVKEVPPEYLATHVPPAPHMSIGDDGEFVIEASIEPLP